MRSALLIWNLVFNLFWIIGTLLFLTHPELFSAEALQQFGDLLGLSGEETENMKNWAVWSLFVLFLVIAVIDTVDGFLRTRTSGSRKK